MSHSLEGYFDLHEGYLGVMLIFLVFS